MKVLFLPDFSKRNPYQKELTTALRDVGAMIIPDVGLQHPLLGAVRLSGRLDVLHLHWTSPFLVSKHRGYSLVKAVLFLNTLLCLKSTGVKIVWTVHNWVNHEGYNPHFERWSNSLLCRICDQIIVHCVEARRHITTVYHLPQRFISKVTVIPHGNFIHTYANNISQEQARKQLGLNVRDTVFLYFGKIRHYKGVRSLIETFKGLPDEHVRLLIVGQPEDEDLYAYIVQNYQSDQRINTRLEFVPDADIQLYMNAADAVVLPFRDVLTSGTVILAMSFGKAVIAPSIGCITETLRFSRSSRGDVHVGAIPPWSPLQNASGRVRSPAPTKRTTRNPKEPTLNENSSFMYEVNDDFGLLKSMQKAVTADLALAGRKNYEYIKQFGWDRIAQKTYRVYRA
jgi:glycosyltransferase involved in cell wall biosynthesis